MKTITQSKKILNYNLLVWQDILKSIDFPESHMNFGAEYCEFHTEQESKYLNTRDIENESTLPLSLEILKNLNLDAITYCLSSDASWHEDYIYLHENINDEISKKLINSINYKIDNTKNCRLILGILISDVSNIDNKVNISKILIKSRYNVEDRIKIKKTY